MSHAGIPKRHRQTWHKLEAQGWSARETEWGWTIYDPEGEIMAQEPTWAEALEQVVMA